MSDFAIRTSTPDDLDRIVYHRRRMFEDMGSGTPDLLDQMDAAFRPWLAERLADGRYIGWFAVSPEGQIAAGAGVWLLDWPPGPYDRQPFRAYILNVYTEPEFRRRGLARQLMQAIMDWSFSHDINVLILHASDQGRPVYESLGFTPTNEMRTWKDRDPSAG